jgi:glycosyltransferase involved in cell wall biosynthesis
MNGQSSSQDSAEIVFSMTRLMTRVLKMTPTGVDRVVLAYAQALRDDPNVSFGGINPLFKRYGRLSRRWTLRFIAMMERRWTHGDAHSPRVRKILAFWWMVALFPWPVPRRSQRRRILLDASHSHLDRPRRLREVLRREQSGFVPLVHDLIPIEFPEYARDKGSEQHTQRMALISQCASAVLTNSFATADAVRRLLGRTNPDLPVIAAPLGIERHDPAVAAAVAAESPFSMPGEPYFLCVGTIEPRKNHLLLLHLWRRMAAEGPDDAVPRLMIVGRRGWENENIIDMLERSPGIRAHVTELGMLPDGALLQLMAGARALLLPSFAEGFGLPVAEALGQGVPVLCSDLPVLREVGGDAPEFLDPLDGPAWLEAVRDYAREDSRRRADQRARIARWQTFAWDAHMDIVRGVVHKLAQVS